MPVNQDAKLTRHRNGTYTVVITDKHTGLTLDEALAVLNGRSASYDSTSDTEETPIGTVQYRPAGHGHAERPDGTITTDEADRR